MRLVRGDIVGSPFATASFDAVFSSYVAEHFEDGPHALLREIHRLLKPDGLLILIVPYNNWFRRLVTNRALQGFYLVARLRGRPLAFTEYRYRAARSTRFCAPAASASSTASRTTSARPGRRASASTSARWSRRAARRQAGSRTVRPRCSRATLNAVSPWLCSAGVLFVARRVTVDSADWTEMTRLGSVRTHFSSVQSVEVSSAKSV